MSLLASPWRTVGMLTALFIGTLSFGVVRGLGIFGATPAAQSGRAQKKECSEYYPLPADYQNWHCKEPSGVGSPCGGPEQCSCEESQRLIVFECDRGTYKQCYGVKGNGCKGN